MKTEPVKKYDKPKYSTLKMVMGKILPAGIITAALLTSLSACRENEPNDITITDGITAVSTQVKGGK